MLRVNVSELYGSPTLQADSLLSEPPGKPTLVVTEAQFKFSFKSGESLGSSGNMVEFRVLKYILSVSFSGLVSFSYTYNCGRFILIFGKTNTIM